MEGTTAEGNTNKNVEQIKFLPFFVTKLSFNTGMQFFIWVKINKLCEAAV